MLKRVVILAASLLAVLTLMEVVLRLAGRGPKPVLRHGSRIAYRFPPSEPREMRTGKDVHLATAGINEMGLRGAPPAPEREPGTSSSPTGSTCARRSRTSWS